MNKYLIPILLALGFVIVGIFTLADYGINWDAPVHMMRGQAFAEIYLTGDKTFNLPSNLSPMIIKPGEIASRYYYIPEERWEPISSLPERPLFRAEFEDMTRTLLRQGYGGRVSFYQSEIWNGNYWLTYDQPHLPLIDTLAAFSNRFFWGGLGIVGDIESYQLVYVLFSALGVFLVSLLAYQITHSSLRSSGQAHSRPQSSRKATSIVAAVVAGLSLGLFPIYFAESHINMKDPQQATFFLGSIWAFYHWVKSNKLKWFVLLTIFIALSLAVKWNIIFLPFILLPWLFLIRKTEQFKKWFKVKKLLVFSLVALLFTVLFLVAVWPAAWSNPLVKLVETVTYYFRIGISANKLQPEGFVVFGFNTYPLISAVTQTPEIILILVILGIWKAWHWQSELRANQLILLWFFIPLLRISLPGMNSYTGMRQILEMLPAGAILAGLGAVHVYEVLSIKYKGKRRGTSKLLSFGLVGLVFILLVVPIIRLHPNENVYFNILVKAVPVDLKAKLYDWGITYGNIYKQGVLWLNEHAEEDANLAHLNGPMYAISPLWLREDISVSPDHFSGFDQKGEYILMLYNPLDPPVFANRYPEQFLNPVHEIKVDDVPLLVVYKNDPELSLVAVNQEKSIKGLLPQLVESETGDFWKVDLGREVRVTRLFIRGVDPACIEDAESNEYIALVSQVEAAELVDLSQAYVINETRVTSKQDIEYSFPAETARYLLIFPRNDNSCITEPRRLTVKYLEV